SRTRERRMGVIVIRALAAGALSGVEERHPLAVPTVDPIATAPDYRTDVARARALQSLVSEGHVANLIEASVRLAVSSDAVSTVTSAHSTSANACLRYRWWLIARRDTTKSRRCRHRLRTWVTLSTRISSPTLVWMMPASPTLERVTIPMLSARRRLVRPSGVVNSIQSAAGSSIALPLA